MIEQEFQNMMERYGGGNWQKHLTKTTKSGGHMRVNHEVLQKLLDEAFTAGQNTSHELKEQTIEEMLISVQNRQQQPWEVLSFAELCALPSGRKVLHALFGEGLVVSKNGERFVQFAGFRMELAEEGWPWTEKLQVIN
jgi:hypothetical protein